MTTTQVDYIIVGHGIAGALLGYFLERDGCRCWYIDHPQQKGATQVAAGIINPITGRRFVKAWRVDELLPFAQQTYRQLESELKLAFYHEQPLIRTLFNRGDENNWQARVLDDAYTAYFKKQPELGQLPEVTKTAFGYMEVVKTAQVSIGQLVQALQEKRKTQGQFSSTSFKYQDLHLSADGVRYQGVSASHIVFCEGWRGHFNPWFEYLPFRGNKGEVLLVRLPEIKLERMLKHRIFLVPFYKDLYWVGATSENEFADDQPSTRGYAYLEERLGEVLTTPFEIVEHQAAIRPTVKDRRPFLGRHPDHHQLSIFNGLGTKGASLAPFWAKHLVQHLNHGQPLESAVDIRRFM